MRKYNGEEPTICCSLYLSSYLAKIQHHWWEKNVVGSGNGSDNHALQMPDY